MSRLTRLFAFVALVCTTVVVCACAGDVLRVPDSVVPGGGRPDRVAVDPAIDAWFRSTRPAAPGTLRAGDRVRVELQGLSEYDVTRDVPHDGALPLFRAAETIHVLGMTLQELEAAVTKAYAGTVDAYVTVSLVAAAPRLVYVAGAVRNPQSYTLRPGERLTVLQVLTLAGGATPEADLYGVTIMRLHSERGDVVSSPPLDIESVQSRGDQTDNLVVLPGDTVVVPEATARQVHVLGHIETPGPLRWYAGLTLSRAVTESGGFRKFARTDAIRIVRGGDKTFVFDFTELLSGAVPDLPLEPGDVVFVDEKWI